MGNDRENGTKTSCCIQEDQKGFYRDVKNNEVIQENN